MTCSDEKAKSRRCRTVFAAPHLLPSRLSGLAAVGLLFCLSASAAWATDPLEDHLQMATDGDASHLFTLNPAAHKPSAAEAAVLAMRHGKEALLDQTPSGGNKIHSTTNDDFLAFGAMADLGAGAGFGLSHETLYHNTVTSVEGRNRDPLTEETKVQHSQAKLLVELTDELKAGLAVRYLYKEALVYGDPDLKPSDVTRYKTTMVGYGSGLAYKASRGGVAYAYYPPLRGKADIDGEERIVVERGEIAADGHVHINSDWTAGLVYKRWINEIDELAAGTTASDDQTKISLGGLDVDQYVIPKEELLVGADFVLNKQTTLRGSVGRENAEFNFRDYMRYNRISVNQQERDAHDAVNTTRVRAMIRFVNLGVAIDAGAGYYVRKHDFPQTMKGGSYEATGREVFATLTMKL